MHKLRLYADKTITITGKLTKINPTEKSITVDEKLYGTVDSDFKNLKINDSVILKGRLIGYDELLEEVKMDQITIIN